MKTKFRCWDELKGKMYFWTLNDLLCRFDVDTGYNEDDIPSPFFEWMQYTGLKDKNGKEIYEKDILKYPSGKIGWVEMYDGWGVSTKDKEFISIRKESPITEDVVCEIIGNIYENPELLS